MTAITTSYDFSQINNLQSQLMDDLRLSSFEEIGDFFPSSNDKGLSKIPGWIVNTVNRIAHLIFTGVWINKSMVGKLINEYRVTKVFSGAEEDEIKKVFDEICGEKSYESLFKSAMKGTWMDKLHNNFSFFTNFIKNPLTVGAVLPSSRALASKVSKHVTSTENTSEGRNILEIGPGTGEFTYEIVKNLNPKDRLDLVEYDEQFCKVLQQRFGHLKNVNIKQISIIDLKIDDYKYDAIISGLPLNAFSSEFVDEVCEKFEELSNEGAHLSYFEYPLLANIKKLFMSKNKKRDLETVLQTKNDFYQKYKESSEIVWLNVPPARAKHCIIMHNEAD